MTCVDQTSYWKVHWLMSCESYPSMMYCSFLFCFFVIFACLEHHGLENTTCLYMCLKGLCNYSGCKVLQHASADVLEIMSSI